MICHVSFGVIKDKKPAEWLTSIPYFTCILSKTAEKHPVTSVHFAFFSQRIVFENVTYEFIKVTSREMLLQTNVIKVIRGLNPDAIILHGFHSSIRLFRLTSQLKGFRIFIQHHGEKVFGFPKSIIHKRIDKRITGYFFSSAEIGNDWVNAGLIESSSKVYEILEVTSPFSAKANRISRESQLNFIWVGRLDANKDPLTLVRGFISFLDHHPNANLYIIFQTRDLLEEVKKEVMSFGNNIHLIGEVPHDQMPLWYAKADFIISTSLFEAGGVSVLEGISCGCIPILTDIPSFKMITGNGAVGFIFPKCSYLHLADTLVKAAQSDLNTERKNLINHFQQKLSSTAIADQIIALALPSRKAPSSF